MEREKSRNEARSLVSLHSTICSDNCDDVIMMSLADRVLGWGTKLIGSIGGVSRDLAGDNTHSPASLTRDGGLHLESPSGKPLFNPSLPGQVQATPTTPHSSGHKRHRSFLSARRLARRRHNDGRHGHKQSLFPNPFRGGAGKGAEFARLGSQRSEVTVSSVSLQFYFCHQVV